MSRKARRGTKAAASGKTKEYVECVNERKSR